ncbi:hypothetical protein IFM89_034587 [Coptis chinensis]|uniref:Uncharacterized protein n=1 Tax=Coptis chinensis TaxID=261450 RepID=A0A835HPS4_9MAGN|nr:hypothetical protein IFM89_034587 [Coptis chinensis]
MARYQQIKDYTIASSHKSTKWENQLHSTTAVTTARTQDEVTRAGDNLRRVMVIMHMGMGMGMDMDMSTRLLTEF